MFILVEIPFADHRPLVKGQMGRVPSPDWTADDPGRSFIRGFGKVASRNADAYGLLGERYFADFNNAVRLRHTLSARQDDWPASLDAELRFRRLYYDGELAGRFEFGFLIKDDDELKLDRHLKGLVIDPRLIAAAALASPIGVIAPDCDEQGTTIQGCAKLLGQAYLAATTLKAELNAFPPGELYGTAVALGAPLVHIRIANGLETDVGRDKTEAEGTDGALYFTSAAKSDLRNNVVVRLSKDASDKETAGERAVRVLFAHLHALIYAQSHFLKVQKALNLGGRAPLHDAVTLMLKRLENFTPSDPKDTNDRAFSDALVIWAHAYKGRTDELAGKLAELAQFAEKPTLMESGRTYMSSLLQLVITTGVKAVIEQGAKATG
jgi:hypothetical protein